MMTGRYSHPHGHTGKTNTFPSKNDKNIISHAAPPVGSCHKVDEKTRVVYLVRGGGAAGADFEGVFCRFVIFFLSLTECAAFKTNDCEVRNRFDKIDEDLKREDCIELPPDVGSIKFGL